MRWTALGLGHPGTATLNRYVDGELTAAQSRRVSTHVMACRTCRGFTDGVNQLRANARALPTDDVPRELLDRVLARRAAGERMILPVTDAAPRRSPNVAALSVAASAVIAIVGVFALGGRRAVAAGADGIGELTFEPSTPRPGDTLKVTYVAPEQLRHSDVVMLRSRVVSDSLMEGEPTSSASAHRDSLRRTSDNRYEGTFVFPSGAALALFAVEDVSAQHVDSRHRGYWRVTAHDAGGHLSYAAALAAAGSGSSQGWDRRYQNARELVRDYPDSLAAWRVLAFLENVVHGQSDTAAWATHRRTFVRFEAKAKALRSPPPDMLAGLMWYASTLSDTARRSYWKERLLRAAPRHPLAVQERAADIITTDRPRPGASPSAQRAAWKHAIAEFDRLWDEVGNAHPTLITMGYQVSSWAGDAEGLRRWGGRYSESDRGDAWASLAAARQLTAIESIRPEGMRMLRALLQQEDPISDPRRGLWQSVDEYRAAGADLRGSALQELGEALLAEGRHEAALDTLRLATGDGWNLDRFRAIAEATLRAGDTLAAIRSFAWVAADPETSPAFADSVLSRLRMSAADARWVSARADAPATMRSRVLHTAIRRGLRGDSVRLTDAKGRQHTFGDIAKGRVTIVAFGLDLRLGSPVNVAKMNRIAARLPPGAQVIAIPISPRTDNAEAAVRARGIDFGVYFDPANEASRAFNAYGFPMYFVVDADGDLRFAYSSPSQLLAQASALMPYSKR